MANSHEILFARRNPSEQSIFSITHIGGRLSEGAEWSIPCTEAIKGIQSGRFEFYIRNDAGTVEKLIVARHRQHGIYLKSEADAAQANRLLNLPEKLAD
tara:strand:+ start:1669 stop:1965 length:297 start_codon:yes stop_codon:yes gene_type:complete